MVQTVTSEDFSRVYSPNVVETLQQRIMAAEPAFFVETLQTIAAGQKG